MEKNQNVDYNYWQVKLTKNYFAVSSIQKDFWIEYKNGTIINAYNSIRKNLSQVLLYNSYRNAYVLLGPGYAAYRTSIDQDFFKIRNGTWVASIKHL